MQIAKDNVDVRMEIPGAVIRQRSLQAVLRCSLLLSLGLAGSLAHAQAAAQEQAVTWTAGDPQLNSSGGPARRSCPRDAASPFSAATLQMEGDCRLGRHFKEHVDVVFCGVAVKYGDAASFGQERRARPPRQLRFIGSPRHCLLWSRRLCVGERADQAQRQQQRTSQCHLQ